MRIESVYKLASAANNAARCFIQQLNYRVAEDLLVSDSLIAALLR